MGNNYYSNDNLFDISNVSNQSYIDSIGQNSTAKWIRKNKITVDPLISSPLFKKRFKFLKRTVDVLASLTVIIFILLWLLPILALLVVLDSKGPVFFVQKRNKQGSKLFHCIKIRTMVINDESDKVAAVVNDLRITRLGRFLRISHIDELPQFFNVLIGDMSMVGPRPHMLVENVRFNEMFSYYNDRHYVKPGITGLAQSYGFHGAINDLNIIDKKTEFDIYYIKNWSVMMDIKIVARTVLNTLKKIAGR
ncbi:sugar transferase [Mucilaginibacter glaciei]|uniref:Sugar transferase n=1 Tax=Mucilaginibacter glaciei TaxID=2772109 RepID=A0A926S0G0_9SPHI|nr:sugar transferase [Mucilaginibacter glaciei]MBD1391692.1 sugar transferase [Mucilaginibacter glaciei]